MRLLQDRPDLAIRDSDWKLLIFRNGSKPELFNMADDPNESKNLAAEHPDRVRRMSEQVIQWDKTVQAAAR